MSEFEANKRDMVGQNHCYFLLAAVFFVAAVLDTVFDGIERSLFEVFADEFGELFKC